MARAGRGLRFRAGQGRTGPRRAAQGRAGPRRCGQGAGPGRAGAAGQPAAVDQFVFVAIV